MKTLRAAVPLMLFWLVLTASVRPVDLAIGVVVSALLGWWAASALWRDAEPPILTLRQSWRFCLYIPWLLKEIVVAAVGVAEKVLDPAMPVDPCVIVHRSPLTRPVSRVAFANSITLTPGTLTLDMEDGAFTVHCLAPDFAAGIENGDMERRIHRVFEE